MGGVVYLALWIYGLVIDQTSSANVVPVNTADNWLHLVLGAGMVALGLLLARTRAPGGPAPVAEDGGGYPARAPGYPDNP